MDVFSESARLGALIRQLQGVLKFLTGFSVQVGSDSMVWAASTDSGPKTVPHSLGRVPVLVGVFNADTAGSFAGIASFTTAARGASSFDVYGRTPAAVTATKAIFWIAIG